MKLKEIYDLAVKMGIKNDPREEAGVAKYLERQKKYFAGLNEEEKAEFDQERLNNPYSDTRVLNGESDCEVKRILTGIDIEVGEVLLADRLTEKGQKIDMIITHHPEGQSLAGLYDVMHIQEDILHLLGVPINIAEGILAPRITEIERKLLPTNHNRAVDAAKLLGFPFMTMHTVADNCVNKFLYDKIDEVKPETVKDVVKMLKAIPEFQKAVKTGAGPKIVVGDGNKRCGKVFIDMTGGTGGPKEQFERLAIAGIGTVVCMHISDDNRKEAEKNHINIIVAGHIACDSLGMNLILDEFKSLGVEIVTCSGLTRVERK